MQEKSKQKRLDVYLVDAGYATSREQARGLILAGHVRVGTTPVTKGGYRVPREACVTVLKKPHPYVSRGAIKLLHAMDQWAISVHDRVCLDSGASTGGFTEILLQRGARKVFAIDVGYGQLAWALRQDPRVVVLERTNLRHITPERLGEPIDVVTLDLSFVSLTKIFPVLPPLLNAESEVIALVKPQFEVGKGHVGKGGIVRDPAARERAVHEVCSAATALGWTHRATITSPITGTDGNVEYLVHFTIPSPLLQGLTYPPAPPAGTSSSTRFAGPRTRSSPLPPQRAKPVGSPPSRARCALGRGAPLP
ncbi:MAG: TlyA family RNA methyltransferase [Deltaproteobacteria bacterium]|nr:TlyA family RNA methyltransferase [Deltaproteobacteria bacterium]